MSDIQLHETTNYPPGWNCKYDTKTGKCYYINYLTKAMQLEDPRIRYRQLQNEHASTESIPLQTSSQGYQPLHGSPYHVYPIHSHPYAVKAFQAFQAPNTASLYNVSTSPLLTNKMQKMEMSPVMRMGSPSVSRIIQHFDRGSQNLNCQETSFTTQADTDAAVAKINTMFPTASDTHIRLLLKKYYNREAVVISALQVEKHPLITPGPFSTPPLPRHPLSKKHSLITMTPPMSRFEAPTSRTNSPMPARPGSCASGSYSPRIGEVFRSSPKPHSSPKMKLRYLKSIYPKAEEMLLLDILANADNNVQKASEKLTSIGYEKRDTTAPKKTNRDREEQVMKERMEAENTPPPQPRLKSNEEKQKIKNQLKARYKDVAGRIITMALDSVDYSEEKACKILEIVMQDDKSVKNEYQQKIKEDASVENESGPPSRNQNISPPDGTTNTDESRSDSASTPTAIPKDETKSTLAQDDENNSDETVKIAKFDRTSKSSPESLSSPSDIENSPYNAKNPPHKNGSRSKAKSHHAKPNSCVTTDSSDDVDADEKNGKHCFKTPWNMKKRSTGPIGPNEDLLLADYIAWNGANANLCKGNRGLAKGSDSSLRTNRLNIAQGPKNDLCKGPQTGLAKGSIFAQIKLQPIANVKCS